MLLDVIDFGLSPAEAVTAPRFGTNHFLGSFRQTKPDLGSLRINPEVGDDTLADLGRRGHRVRIHKGALWAPSVLTIDPKSRVIHGAGDPKAGRHAAAY
jgi:gamma-glutamyltranspeptidase/glutathione hydrolase